MATTTITGPGIGDFLVGAAEWPQGRHGGVCPRRLPAWSDTHHSDAMFAMIARTAAGVRLRLRTRGTHVRIDLATTTVEVAGGEAPRPPVLSVLVGERRVAEELPMGDIVELDEQWQPARIRPTAAVSLQVDDAAGQVVEIWLPHDRTVELITLRSDGDLTPAGESGQRWVHYGSSISHGLEAPAPDLTWPARVARSQGWSLCNYSFAGNAMLDPFISRLIAAERADLITLKVGINIVGIDGMRERILRPLWHGALDTIRAAHPHTPIVVITAIACPAVEKHPGPIITLDGRAVAADRSIEPDAGALTLEGTRRLAREVVEERSGRDQHLHLMEGTELFGNSDIGYLYDGLHPSPEGTALIARRFPAALDRAVNP